MLFTSKTVTEKDVNKRRGAGCEICDQAFNEGDEVMEFAGSLFCLEGDCTQRAAREFADAAADYRYKHQDYSY